jgi:hypothetical protein
MKAEGSAFDDELFTALCSGVHAFTSISRASSFVAFSAFSARLSFSLPVSLPSGALSPLISSLASVHLRYHPIIRRA